MIGDVYSVNALFGHVEWRDRGFLKELGGGTTLDMGIYCIQVLATVFFFLSNETLNNFGLAHL